MLEIERKFLLNEIPENIENCEKQEILQWYFEEHKTTKRVRKTTSYKNGRKYITYTLTRKQGKGLIREEEEKKISEKSFEEYRTFAQQYQIQKTRYLYPHNNTIIEINQFHNNLDWLWMAEVEFWSEKESKTFDAPSRCYKEVTEKKEATNRYLAVYWMDKLIKKTNYKDIITKFQLKSFYNNEAKKYSQTRKKHRSDATKILDHLQNYPKKNIKIIEVGCGSWRFLQHLELLKDKNIEYTGIDLSERLIEEAKKISLKKNIKATFICKDMVTYLSECKQESIDIIVGIASFQHLANKKLRYLSAKHMYRCLFYEGEVLMTNRSFSLRMVKKHRKTMLTSIKNKLLHRTKSEWNNLFIHWKSNNILYKRFYHIFTKKELKEIFSQSGFVIEEIEYITKEGIPTNDRKEANNTITIAKKSIFIP